LGTGREENSVISGKDVSVFQVRWSHQKGRYIEKEAAKEYCGVNPFLILKKKREKKIERQKHSSPNQKSLQKEHLCPFIIC